MTKENEKKVRHASIVLSGTPDAEYVYSHGTEGIEGKEKKGEKEEKNAQDAHPRFSTNLVEREQPHSRDPPTAMQLPNSSPAETRVHLI